MPFKTRYFMIYAVSIKFIGMFILLKIYAVCPVYNYYSHAIIAAKVKIKLRGYLFHIFVIYVITKKKIIKKIPGSLIVISHFLFHGLTLLSIKLKEDTARRNLTHSLTEQKRQQATTLAKSACCLTTTWLSPAMPCKTMILISVKDYNQFSQDYYESIINSLQFHQLTCTCGHSSCLSVHGYYTRGIILPDGKHFLRICRVKCSECGKTHALLLTSIVPYDRISLSDQHTIVCAFENGTDKYAVCEDNPSLDESNVRSVIRRYCLYWLQRLLAEKISLSAIPSLIRECLAAYSMQFMQIHRTEAVLFVCTT